MRVLCILFKRNIYTEIYKKKKKTMNNYKIIIKLNKNPLILSYRNVALCRTVEDRKCNNINNKHLVNKILIPDKHIKRNLSLNGFVDWQTQTYNSISNSYLVNTMQDGLLYFHDLTGLSWWATIVISTIFVRASITLPLTVYQNYILAKVENISLELKDLVQELKNETAIAKKVYNLTDRQCVILYKRSLKKQWQNLIVRDNCHPFKASLVVWFQIPIWVCMSFALRNIVYMQSADPAALITFMELSVGGFGWIPNLTETDHSLILPIALGLTNLAIIEIQRMSKLREPSKMYNVFTNIFRVLSIVMIPVAASVPSCMCLYWATSSGFGLIQNIVLLSPTLRRKLKIPIAPSELENPYQHINGEIRRNLERIIPKL